ncbi:hypothetical protein Tco_0978036 [Tanacetum coccineum]|uniref:Uncharacterized protein n=1 Tax=Tanacetum coccineum TaxID=301880 RepID=A0ABQ5ELX2_9ASTR
MLPIPLPAPSTSHRADILEADTPPRKRLLLTAPRPGVRLGRGWNMREDNGPPLRGGQLEGLVTRKDRAAVRAEIEGFIRERRIAYGKCVLEKNRRALARSEAYSRALEARITVLETQARRHEWQRQDADDCSR